MTGAEIKFFDPRILLGDRLGLNLYVWCAKEYLKTKRIDGPAFALYKKFIRYFREQKEHSPEKFAKLIDFLKTAPYPVELFVKANPKEYSLYQGSHRTATAIALDVKEIPYSLHWQDEAVPEKKFPKIFSKKELEILKEFRREQINSLPEDLKFKCRVREFIRKDPDAFQTAFSSIGKVQTLRTYQGFKELGILGKRPSEIRFEHYDLSSILRREMNVLDLGCNVGFLSTLIARRVNKVTAVDIGETYLELGRFTAAHLGLQNLEFLKDSVPKLSLSEKFDLVLSFAVHGWSKMKFPDYLQRLKYFSKKDGLILFESHELTVEKDWVEKKEQLSKNFKILKTGFIDDADSEMYQSEIREFLLLQNI